MKTLTHITHSSLHLEDNSSFTYTISPYDLKNVLGNVIAVLDKYSCESEDLGTSSFEIYRTKDGTWYDIEAHLNADEKRIIRMLKAALMRHEVKHAATVC